MNKARRAQIEKAQDLIGEARDLLDEARDEEQDYYDNLPENFQNGERGENAQTAISALEDGISALEGISLEDATA